MSGPNKLEFLFLAGFSNLVQCLRVTSDPTRMKHLSSDPVWGWLLALPTNIRLGLKSLPGTSTLTYLVHS